MFFAHFLLGLKRERVIYVILSGIGNEVTPANVLDKPILPQGAFTGFSGAFDLSRDLPQHMEFAYLLLNCLKI